MKIVTHNSFDLRFSSISDINRLTTIDYYRFTIDFIDYRISSIGHAGITVKRTQPRPRNVFLANHKTSSEQTNWTSSINGTITVRGKFNC